MAEAKAIRRTEILSYKTVFLKTATLLNGTKGCGCICAVDSESNLLDIGDGNKSSVILYGGTTAQMIDVPEVNYE